VPSALNDILAEVAAIRADTDRAGELTRPMGTGGPIQQFAANTARTSLNLAAYGGVVSWATLLNVQCAKACAAPADELRAELLQLAAVAVAAVETLDRVKKIEADNV